MSVMVKIPSRIERWIVQFQESQASEMEQSIFQWGMVFLPSHKYKQLMFVLYNLNSVSFTISKPPRDRKWHWIPYRIPCIDSINHRWLEECDGKKYQPRVRDSFYYQTVTIYSNKWQTSMWSDGLIKWLESIDELCNL